MVERTARLLPLLPCVTRLAEFDAPCVFGPPGVVCGLLEICTWFQHDTRPRHIFRALNGKPDRRQLCISSSGIRARSLTHSAIQNRKCFSPKGQRGSSVGTTKVTGIEKSPCCCLKHSSATSVTCCQRYSCTSNKNPSSLNCWIVASLPR